MTRARSRGVAVGLAIFAVLLLAGLSASAMRHVIPGLKSATRSAALRTDRDSKQWRNRFQRTNLVLSGGSAGVEVPVVVVRLRPRRYRFAILRAVRLPKARTAGEDALGTSLPKRMRFKAVGGHGRNGPGSSS